MLYKILCSIKQMISVLAVAGDITIQIDAELASYEEF